jgi:hypothetical protein
MVHSFIAQNWAGVLGGGMFLLVAGAFSQLTGIGIKGTPSRSEDPAAHRFYVVLSLGIGLVAVVLGLIGKFSG